MWWRGSGQKLAVHIRHQLLLWLKSFLSAILRPSHLRMGLCYTTGIRMLFGTHLSSRRKGCRRKGRSRRFSLSMFCWHCGLHRRSERESSRIPPPLWSGVCVCVCVCVCVWGGDVCVFVYVCILCVYTGTTIISSLHYASWP